MIFALWMHSKVHIKNHPAGWLCQAEADCFDSTIVVHWPKQSNSLLYMSINEICFLLLNQLFILFYSALNDLFHCLKPEAIIRSDLSNFLMPTKL